MQVYKTHDTVFHSAEISIPCFCSKSGQEQKVRAYCLHWLTPTNFGQSNIRMSVIYERGLSARVNCDVEAAKRNDALLTGDGRSGRCTRPCRAC